MMATVPEAEGPDEPSSLADRILAIVSRRGYVGITRDELLRKLGAPYDALMASLDRLEAQGRIRVHWPVPDFFRVVYTG